MSSWCFGRVIRRTDLPRELFLSDTSKVIVLRWVADFNFREIDDDGRIYHLTSIFKKKKQGPVAFFRVTSECDSHYARDIRKGGHCQYCGLECRRLTQDHIRPRSHGFKKGSDNVALCCSSCNSRKGARWLGEWVVNEFMMGIHGVGGAGYIYPVLRHNISILLDSQVTLDPAIRTEWTAGLRAIDGLFAGSC
jgi:hypothetical protein